jgi:hypothetical protein
MRTWQRGAALTAFSLALGPWAVAAAQTTLYAGAGIGHTSVLDGGRSHQQGNRPTMRLR